MTKDALAFLAFGDLTMGHSASSTDSASQGESDFFSSSSLLSSTSAFSSAPTPTVPLVAARVALPEDLLHSPAVPLTRVLPSDLVAAYSEENAPALMRPASEVFLLNCLRPLHKPAVAGPRSEYLSLVRRMTSLSMLEFTSTPRAVNGMFAVGKDEEADRIIIDAQPANRHFIDSPHVALANPSHLVQLQLPPQGAMYSGKSDLSNYYHHLSLPQWMRPFFALPPLSPSELRELGLPLDCQYPMCTTMPMGFSHAVFLAQRAHLHVLYSSGALSPSDNLLSLSSPDVTASRVLHGVVIDDFFLFSLNAELARKTLARVLAAYAAFGFVVKQSKVVLPTPSPVKIIGFDIDGSRGTIQLPRESECSLVLSTRSILRRHTVTGNHLAHIIGRWTWVMMLRRPSLAVLQHSYRYIRAAQRRPFTLWLCVRRELCALLSLLPLLQSDLRSHTFHRALASDASEIAAGVVSTQITPQLRTHLWPLCSSRHHAVKQTLLNADAHRSLVLPPDLALKGEDVSLPAFENYYSAVADAPWRTIVSKPWGNIEHVNTLEVRAALLGVHHALSYPSSICSRLFLLVDSTVAFFSLWKGRSSSPSLLLPLRMVSAALLASGMALLPGWLPSEDNPADAPSRLL